MGKDDDAPVGDRQAGQASSPRALRALFPLASDALVLVDDAGVFLDVNAAACELFARPRELLVGVSASDLYEPDFDVVSERRRFLKEGALSGELRVKRRHGTPRTVEFSATKNVASGLHLVSYRDVTDRRLAERRFQALTEKSPDVILLTDANSVVTYASPSLTSILGYEPSELVGRPLLDLVHPDDLPGVKRQVQSVLQDPERPAIQQARFQRCDASWRWLEHTTRNLLHDPAVSAIVSNLRDVDDRRRADALQEHLAAIVASSSDAIVSTTPAGIITTWNARAAEIYGWSAEEVVGKPIETLTAPAELAATLPVLARIAQGEVIRDREATHVRKDGSLINVSITAGPIRDAEGVVVGISRIIRDRTQERKAEQKHRQTEEQLRHAQKMEAIGALAGGVAHDFNNVLSVILSFASLARDDLAPSDPVRNDVGEILRAGERAVELTRQLLTFSRKQVVEPQAMDIRESVLGMDKMLRRLLSEEIDLSLVALRSRGRILADPGQIEQVILNLAVNARDAMPTGGKLTFETADVTLDSEYADAHLGVTPGRYVMLAVTDTGTGMDAATRERAFEPFFTTKDAGKGTGLGLSTVFGIVAQSKGHIWVYSEPGCGTTFKLYFPRVDRTAVTATLVPPEPTTLRGSETVMVVEDEAQVRLAISTILSRAGYHVLDTQNAGEAFLASEQFAERIHLLISDVVMPRMSGPQLAQRLLASRPELKVLYVSGYPDNAVVRHGIVDGGAAFLPKPILPNALLRKVRGVLDGGRDSDPEPVPS